MPYNPLDTDYPANQPRPDAPGNVLWTQSLLVQNYAANQFIIIDKEVKGGLHRVKYKSQLKDYTYDGIMEARRVRGMLVFVEFEDDDTPLGKYFGLKIYPGNSLDHWEQVGTGTTVTVNNPKTVANLDERDASEVSALTGTATTGVGTTNVNGTGTNWAGVDAEIVVGDKFRFNSSTDYYYVESILNEGSLKTTTPTIIGYTDAIINKVVVQPGDFVNVIDARTDVEMEVTDPELPGYVAPYPASFIWDGGSWLPIYPYGSNPYTHVQNTDTGLIVGGAFKSGDEIWNATQNPAYHKVYNDAATLAAAASGTGNEAFTSKRVSQELQLRPPVDIVNGIPTLFLNQKGQWATPADTGGSGGLQPEDFGDSNTTTFELNEETGKYGFEVIPVGATIIETTYDDLVALRNASGLVNGVGYEFDYFTYHLIEYTSEYHTGVTEKIVIFANGLNSFAKSGISRDYPFDILEYDIDFTDGLVRPGFITFRHDTINDLSTYYDFRNYVFRRWEHDVPYYNVDTTYVSNSWDTADWATVQITGGHYFYQFTGELGIPLLAANDPTYGNPLPNYFHNPYWKVVWNTDWFKFFMTNPTSMKLGMSTILAKPSSYIDYYTFNTNLGVGKSGLMKNIHIGKHTKPNNIVIITTTDGNNVYNNTFGTGSYDSTLGNSYNYNNNYGTNFHTNVLLEAKNNKIDTNMQNCWFNADFSNNQVWAQLIQTVGYSWAGNIMYGGVERWIGGAQCNNNISYGVFTNNATAARFTGNICSRSFSGNFLGTSANSNIFLSFFWNTTVRVTVAYCTFMQWVDRVYVYGSMYGCTFKAEFKDTVVGDDASKYLATSSFNFNQFNGNVNKDGGGGNHLTGTKNWFGYGNYNTFQNYVKNVGTQAIPYNTNNSIYNFAVEGLTMVTTGLSVNRVIFNQELKPYAVAANLADVIIPTTTESIPYKTGGVLDFVASYTEFGTEVLPVGVNITLNDVGAVVGHVAQLTHDGVTAPTVGGYDIGVDTGVFHKTSGSYVLGVKNYFVFDYRGSSRINYIIYQ